MNKVVTSREQILEVGKTIVLQQGAQTLNIRAVASLCGISVGSVYNYFPSKTELLSAIIAEIWNDIFFASEPPSDFLSYLAQLFQQMEKLGNRHPCFLGVHSISFTDIDREKGRQIMEDYFLKIRLSLKKVLAEDPLIPCEVFDENLTVDDVVDIVFSSLVSMLTDRNYNYRSFLELLKRTLHP